MGKAVKMSAAQAQGDLASESKGKGKAVNTEEVQDKSMDVDDSSSEEEVDEVSSVLSCLRGVRRGSAEE